MATWQSSGNGVYITTNSTDIGLRIIAADAERRLEYLLNQLGQTEKCISYKKEQLWQDRINRLKSYGKEKINFVDIFHLTSYL